MADTNGAAGRGRIGCHSKEVIPLMVLRDALQIFLQMGGKEVKI
jgi:hypothetical protein